MDKLSIYRQYIQDLLSKYHSSDKSEANWIFSTTKEPFP
jgi:hypothetical protein